MALFKPYKITSDKLADLPVREGQIVITTDTKKLYVDVSATERIEVTSDAEVDLTDYVTTTMLTSALGEEASEREKQDSLLEDLINTKLDTSSADNRYALKNNPELTGDVSITNGGWALGKITAAHPNNDDTNLTYYKYVIGFDSLHRPYFAKYEGETKVSTIYLSSDSVILDQPINFTDASGVGSNSSAANQTRINIGAAAANHTHDLASSFVDGFMSSEDKVKLNNLDSTISAAVSAEATERQQQDTALENAIDEKIGQDNILAGDNINLLKDGINNVTISADSYYAGNGIEENEHTFSLKIQDTNLNAYVGQETEGFILMPHSTTEDGLYGHSIPYDSEIFTGGSSNCFTIKDGGITAEKLAEGVIPEIPEVTLASLGVTATAQELNYTDGVTSNIQTQLNGKAAASHTHDDRYYTESETDDLLAAKANTSHAHSAANITSGTLALDRIPTITDAKIQGMSASKLTGTIPQTNLPSYVDDVLEYNGQSNFPEEGESGKIYVDTSTNKTYRWGGSNYVEISASLALGTTSSTAFRGDYGNTAYTHATAKGSAFSSGLYKITTNSQGHVTAATAVTKNDITALGIPAQDTNTNTTYELTKSGSTITLEGSDGSSTSVTDSNTVYTHPTTSGNKHIPAGGSSGQILRWSADGTAAWGADNNTNTTYTLSKSGSTIKLTGSDGSSTTVTDSNTTYSAMKGATSSAVGSTGLVPAPAAGKQTSFLRGDGTWVVPTNTTYSNMTGATTSAAGKAGLVPAPAAGAATRYLRSDGTWQVPPDTNTTYTLSSFGITATAAELNKLDGLATTKTELGYLDGVTSNVQTQLNGKAASSHSHSAATTSAAGFLPKLGGGTTNFLRADGTWAKPPDTNTTYSQMTGATSSAAGKTGLVPAPAAGYQSRYLRGDGTWATVTAASANQLTTARTFSLTGDVTGSATFNGTANCSIATTLAANSVTANEIASGAVGLSELSSAVGTVAVQSSTPTDSHVKLWIKV